MNAQCFFVQLTHNNLLTEEAMKVTRKQPGSHMEKSNLLVWLQYNHIGGLSLTLISELTLSICSSHIAVLCAWQCSGWVSSGINTPLPLLSVSNNASLLGCLWKQQNIYNQY